MKNIFTVILIMLISFRLSAQMPGGGAAGNKQGKAPAIGHLYGKVIDSAGKPVAQASVVLLQSKVDSSSKKKKFILLKGGTTDNNGDFSFSELPLFNSLQLKISTIGFKENNQQVILLPGAMDKDLGNIKLLIDENQLQNVTVTTSTSSLKMDIDKKTFNVEKNITSAGGTAVDVMKNVPSVQVDIDGNVKLRNASPQIYIDGRPTTLSLDQIPADAIQSVEVITNPSAKFDASGGNAGILNIVLKKNKRTGYNGNLMAGIDSKGGYNTGGNFSVRQNKINLSAAVNVNSRKGNITGNTDQQYFFDTVNIHSLQSTKTKNNGQFIFGKLGLDYYISNRTTLSLSGIKLHGEFKPHDISNISSDSIFNNGNSIHSSSLRNTYNNRVFNATGAQFGLVQNFVKEGHQLTADGNFFSGKNKGNTLYSTNVFGTNGNPDRNITQQQLSDGTNRFLTMQTDYTNPLTKKSKLEAGLRAQLAKTTQNTNLYNLFNGDLSKVANSSINYSNHNNVYAAYTTFTSAIKNFGYQVGLRVESSDYKGILNDTGNFKHNYPVSLFPSVFLSEKLGNKQELHLNYSRRINRPNFFQLIPYTDRTDTLNITRGNPDLVPEFTNSFEFSYSKTYGKKNNTFLASVYYKHTTNLITRFLDTEYNASLAKSELINTYVNANSSYSYGAEFTAVNNVTKWWDFNLNLNLYNSKINTDNLGLKSQDAILSWFGKWNNNFKLPSNFTVQLSANYQSKTNLPISSGERQFGPPSGAQSSSQGYIKSFWSTDIAVKKTFFKKNNGAITVSMSDIFRTRKSEQISTSPFFYQDYSRINNPQLVRVNFSYRFGKLDVALFKRQTKGQNQGLQDASQMGGSR